MAILRLFDVSQYIAAGSKHIVVSNGVVEDSNGFYRSNERPCGGISFLLNTMFEFTDEDTDLVYVFDRPPTYKRKIYEKTFNSRYGYKGNRPKKDNSIIYQRALAEVIIKQLGLQAIAVEGYEADDCIATLVEMYKGYYEKVYVHSRDSDLYSLVSDNVEIQPVGKNGKIVTLANWENTVKSGYVVPFNTLLLNKLIVGEPGDNIPHISKVMADRILAYISEKLYPLCGDNALLRQWVSNATHDDPIVMGTLDLLIPLVVPEDYLELEDAELDSELLEYYGSVMGNKYCRHSTVKPSEIGEETIKQFLDDPEIFIWNSTTDIDDKLDSLLEGL